MRLRLLPMLILVATLMLGVRIGEIWQGFGGIAEAQPDAAAGAQLVEDPFTRLQLAQAGQGGQDADADGRSAGRDGAAAGGEAGTPAAGDAGAGGTDLLAEADPLDMTDAEIELLQQLSARRDELERRADRLDQREQVLQAAEKRLGQKVDELERLRGEIEALLVKYDEQETKQLSRLVAIYEKMKPDDAARIFEDLEMSVLLKVVQRMNERNTAPILAEMRPDKAQELTLELAEREELPLPRE
jgi:flagellar motility protein MotE (MotC chaperone)